MIFEKKHQPLLSRKHFAHRMLLSFMLVLLVVGISLFIGVAGYHHLEQMPWLDALLNASMILGGMGPVDVLHTDGGKLFASFYALYSGIVLIALSGLLLAPIFHRVLHAFHQDEKE